MSWLIGIGTWIKSNVVASIVIGVVVVGGAIATPIIINNLQEQNKTNIELIKDLNIQINSEIKLFVLINSIDNGKLISEDEIIDTSILGEKEISIKYLNETEELKTYSFKITIVDTIPPVIEFKNELTTTVGTKIDLLKDVKVTDNSNEEIKATVKGEHDINKIGTYNLKCVAVDSSGNRTEEDFTLKVEAVKIKTTGYYVVHGPTDSFEFKANGEAILRGQGSQTKGTYTISGDTITVKLSGGVQYKFTIINENQIKYSINGEIWKHSKNPY